MAAAVKQLQDEMPQFITFGMSHYYSEPKRVRFQSEGGKFIDADAIATAFAETTVREDNHMKIINIGILAHVEVVPEFLRTLVFARPRGDDQFADCTFSPSLDMSR